MPLILLIIVMSLNIYYLKYIITFLHTEKIKVFNNKIETVRKIINNPTYVYAFFLSYSLHELTAHRQIDKQTDRLHR